MKSCILNIIDDFISKNADKSIIEKTALWTKVDKNYIYGIPLKKLKARFNKKYISEFYCLNLNEIWEVITTLVESRLLEKQIIAVIVMKEFLFNFSPNDVIFQIHKWTKNNIISSWITADQITINILAPLLLKHNELSDKFILWADDENILIKRMSVVIYAEIELNNNLINALFKTVLKLIDNDNEYIEKSCGWAVRNVYNYNDEMYFDFIEKYGKKMRRKTLRNAIYSLDENIRLLYLFSTKINK